MVLFECIASVVLCVLFQFDFFIVRAVMWLFILYQINIIRTLYFLVQLFSFDLSVFIILHCALYSHVPGYEWVGFRFKSTQYYLICSCSPSLHLVCLLPISFHKQEGGGEQVFLHSSMPLTFTVSFISDRFDHLC